MPTKLDPVILNAEKKTNLGSVHMGEVAQAVAHSLEEFGQKGVQGVVMDKTATKFITDQKAKHKAGSYFMQAGVLTADTKINGKVVSKGSLVLYVGEKTDATFAEMNVLVKDYTKLKAKLAASNASVTNLDPHGDKIISDSVRDTSAKLGAQNDLGFGEITGNIVLTAHGTPAKVPSGRVIGSALGRRTPEQIVDLLTTDKDPKKRVSKKYNGTLTLCGCFTASGGPEGEKQDDAFAKKVLDLFRKKGYKAISVVGYPGATITDSGANTDSQGTATRQGDERVLANQPTAADRERAKKMEAETKKRIEAYNALVEPYNQANDRLKAARKEVDDAVTASGGSRSAYAKTKDGKAKLAALKQAETDFKAVEKQIDAAEAKKDEAKKAYQKSGLGDTFAQLEGRFGLRRVN